MKNKIELVVRSSVKNRPLLYPANESAQLILDMTGLNTIREKDVEILIKLGFDVEIIGEDT